MTVDFSFHTPEITHDAGEEDMLTFEKTRRTQEMAKVKMPGRKLKRKRTAFTSE